MSVVNGRGEPPRQSPWVRSHGVPNWPDPLAGSDPGQPGTPGFPRSMPGVNHNAPHVKRAMGSCQHLIAGIGRESGGYP
jgi:hypothetical protein